MIRTKQGLTLHARLLKYYINGAPYVCLTNFEASTAEVKRLYGLRWRVETSFRRLKSDLNLEKAHWMTPRGYVQEVQARILYDTVTVLSLERGSGDNESMGGRALERPAGRIRTYLRALDEFLDIIYLIKVRRESKLNRAAFPATLFGMQRSGTMRGAQSWG